MRPKKAILFDLDGTLLDSAPDITLALNKSLIKNQLNPIDEFVVRNLIGNGSAELISKILIRKTKKVDRVLHKKIHCDFLDAYERLSNFFSELCRGMIVDGAELAEQLFAVYVAGLYGEETTCV